MFGVSEIQGSVCTQIYLIESPAMIRNPVTKQFGLVVKASQHGLLLWAGGRANPIAGTSERFLWSCQYGSAFYVAIRNHNDWNVQPVIPVSPGCPEYPNPNTETFENLLPKGTVPLLQYALMHGLPTFNHTGMKDLYHLLKLEPLPPPWQAAKGGR